MTKHPFIAMRARHFADTDRMDLADRDYALARSLLPNHRLIWKHAMAAAAVRGTELFHPGEPDGPTGLALWMNSWGAAATLSHPPHETRLDLRTAEIERLNAINRMRIQPMQVPGQPGSGLPGDPHAPIVPHHPSQGQPFNPYGPWGPQ